MDCILEVVIYTVETEEWIQDMMALDTPMNPSN